MQQLTEAAAADNGAMKSLTEAAVGDSAAMKQIAYVSSLILWVFALKVDMLGRYLTMVFMPASFVAVSPFTMNCRCVAELYLFILGRLWNEYLRNQPWY